MKNADGLDVAALRDVVRLGRSELRMRAANQRRGLVYTFNRIRMTGAVLRV
jgi:hypothetical protein